MPKRKKGEEIESVFIQPKDTEHVPSKYEELRRQPLYRPKLDEQSLISLQTQMQNYFLLKAEEKRPPTLVGLANYLGVHRNTMKNYADRNPGFRKLYDMAKQYCEEVLVEGTLTQKLNVVGGIFILKNHFEDYIDKKEVSTTSVFVDADSIEEFKSKRQKRPEGEEADILEVRSLPSGDSNP